MKKDFLFWWYIIMLTAGAIALYAKSAEAFYLPPKTNNEFSAVIMHRVQNQFSDEKKNWKFSTHILKANFGKKFDVISNFHLQSGVAGIGNTMAYLITPPESPIKVKLLGGGYLDTEVHIAPTAGLQLETERVIVFGKSADGHLFRAGFKWYSEGDWFHLGLMAEGSERDDFLCAGIIFGFQLSKDGVKALGGNMGFPGGGKNDAKRDGRRPR